MRTLLLPTLFFLTLFSIAQVPVNWKIDEVDPGKDVTLYIDNEFFTEGDRSCNLQLNSSGVPYLISERFAVEEGSNYTFSIDVFDNDTVGQLKVYCDFFDASGNNVYGEQPALSQNSEEWQTLAWTGILPAGAVEGYVLIKFYCEPNPTSFVDTAFAWVDNCSFTEEGGSNLVANGSFEDWAVGMEDHQEVANAFQLYPNPARDYVHVYASVSFDLVRISDLSGKIIVSYNFIGKEKELDISNLHSGIYILQLIKNQALIGSLKLIKK